MTSEQLIIAANLLIEKSDRNFEQAYENAKLGYWDLVANRLYYSIFHAVTALMLIDGIKSGTHKGTSAQFGKHYILTNKFSRNDGILYSRLQTIREKADYQNTFTLSESEGRNLLNETQQLQARLTSAIKERASRS